MVVFILLINMLFCTGILLGVVPKSVEMVSSFVAMSADI